MLTVSCTVEQTLELDNGLSGTWILSGQAMPFTAEALNDLALLGGYDDAGALYDQMILDSQADMSAREDIDWFKAERTGPQSWEAEIGFNNLESLMGSTQAEGIAEMIRGESVSTLNLRFSRERAGSLEELMPMLKDPALSLFNPAATANISQAIYVNEILGFTFGKENIPAIQASRIVMDIKLPGPVVQMTGGEQTGDSSVRFTTPFTDFLAPEDEIFWSVSWANGS